MNATTEKIIGIRELTRNTKDVYRDTRRGISFVVMRNTEPLFRIEPIGAHRKGKHTLADLLSIRFRSGDKDLSKKVDTVVYGV